MSRKRGKDKGVEAVGSHNLSCHKTPSSLLFFLHTQFVTFQLESCAAKALTDDTMLCQEYDVRVPLRHLVPDLFLTDLPEHLQIDYTQVEVDFQNTANHLSSGGAGVCGEGGGGRGEWWSEGSGEGWDRVMVLVGGGGRG